MISSVTCSYDEVLRFKSSAAAHAANTDNTQGLFSAGNGLIQAVIDNYDANIHSLNGLKSTHALALLMCQSYEYPVDHSSKPESDPITRLSKNEMKETISDPVQVQKYYGPKRPDMPAPHIINDEEFSDLVQRQGVSVARAHQLDLNFLKSIVTSDKVPEYGGYITSVSREQNHTVKPATNTRYRPLIDLTPSDPSTIKTVLLEAQTLTTSCGQPFVVITADQQLYRVIVANIWATPELFSNVYPRLGGMHTIMSFCGAVGKLMMDTGLVEILKHAFGGFEKMLSGKKYPQNVRAFRLMTEELLHKHLEQIQSTDDLEKFFTDVSNKSNTSKLWVDCFVWPTFIIMAFTRAERESDWPLHLWALRQIMPYFLLPHMWIMLGMGCVICTPWKSFHQKPNTTFYEGSTLCGIHLAQQTQPGLTCSLKLPLWCMGTVRVASQELHWMTMLHSAGLSAFIAAVVWSVTWQPWEIKRLRHQLTTKKKLPGESRLMLLTGINCVRSWLSVLIYWILMVTHLPCLILWLAGLLSHPWMYIELYRLVQSRWNHMLTNCQRDSMTLLAALSSPCLQPGRQRTLDQAKHLTQVWYSAGHLE